MRRTTIAFALGGGLALAALSALPAAAGSNCYDTGSTFGLHIEFGVHFGEPYTAEEELTFAQMRLRQRGIDVVDAEYWGGCIRAYVRNPSGHGTHWEFFNAETLEPVDSGPGRGLDLTLPR